jgi:hypothetical protein
MPRFLSALTTLALLGCAGAVPSDAPLLRLCSPPPNAFAVAPDDLGLPAQPWRQHVDPAALFAADLQDFPAGRLLPGEEGAATAADAGAFQPLLEILRDFVAPGRWDRASLSVDKGALVTEQSPPVLAALQSALKTLRDNRGRLIHSEVRMVALRSEALARVENIPPASGGLVGTFDRKALGDALRGDAPAATRALASGLTGTGWTPTGREGDSLGILAPSVTTYHGQKSHVMFLAQKSYVAGYSVGEGGPEPQMSVTTEGVVAELRTIANGARPDEFLVSFDVQVASPSQVVDVRLASGVIQMPAQGFAHLSVRCALRADQALLLVTRNPDVRQTERPIVALIISVGWTF